MDTRKLSAIKLYIEQIRDVPNEMYTFREVDYLIKAIELLIKEVESHETISTNNDPIIDGRQGS